MSTTETLAKQTGAPRVERLEARVSAELKELFQQAADLQGVKLSDFVIGSARQAAVHTLQEHQRIRLSQRDAKTFVDALLRPAAPGARLRAAARRYQKDLRYQFIPFPEKRDRLFLPMKSVSSLFK